MNSFMSPYPVELVIASWKRCHHEISTMSVVLVTHNYSPGKMEYLHEMYCKEESGQLLSYSLQQLKVGSTELPGKSPRASLATTPRTVHTCSTNYVGPINKLMTIHIILMLMILCTTIKLKHVKPDQTIHYLILHKEVQQIDLSKDVLE